ncbi:hypothetical protein SISSUDRAFT_1056939 [Sistotremastrum suecicum HHB10207 ss-3]|nr:hypothetical protein SISSUDRAFT_1056939 [Sistotremastrum suecicum HHB10207 ss-3]
MSFPIPQSHPKSRPEPEDGELEPEEGQVDETLPPESHNDDTSDIASTPPSTPRITPASAKPIPKETAPPKLSLPKKPSAPSSPPFTPENLHLTAEQLWEAKVLILDLLGWGVPPTYMVDCGLTKEIIYTVFTELNLRLPENLDLSGLKKSP